MNNQNNRPGQPGGYNNKPQQRPAQPGGYYNQPQQRPAQPGGYYNQPQQRPAQPGGHYNQPQQRPAQPGGYYNQPQQRPAQPGGYYNQPQQRPVQPGGYYNQPQQRPIQSDVQANKPQPINPQNPQKGTVSDKSDIKKNKKKAKAEKKVKNDKGGKGNKKGMKIVAVLLVLAIVFGIVGVVAYVFSGENFVSASTSVIETGAVADVTFKDNVKIISDTETVQKDFQNVSVNGDEYTISYGDSLPTELSALKVGETFCVPSIEGAELDCFEMGFCGEVISKAKNSITFKIPSMDNVFSAFSFNLNGGTTPDSAEFTPAAGVSVIRNAAVTKSNFVPLASSVPNVELAKKADYESSVKIGSYTISPAFSYIEPTQQSILPGYSMLCDELVLKIEVEKEFTDNISASISGIVNIEDLATKININWYEDEAGNQIVDEFDVGVMANVKSEITIGGEAGFGLSDLPKPSEANDIFSQADKIIAINDVTSKEEDESGKVVLGAYVIGFNAELPGLVNSTNKIGYLSAGLVIQFFISAKGEIELECKIENSGFYAAEVNSETGFSGYAKGYDYPSPALYNGSYTEEMLSSTPKTTFSATSEINLNAAAGVDVGLCILGMVPIKLANNFIEFDATLQSSDEQTFIDTILDKNKLLKEHIELFTTKSNSTLKIHLGAKLKLPIEMNLASFGFEKLIYEKVWYQYPDPIPFDHSQCGFGNVFVGESYTPEQIDTTFKAFEKEHDIDGLLNDFKDGVGNAVIDTFKYELNAILSQADIDLYEEMGGTVKYFSSGAMYFVQENKVVMSIITGENICNAGGLTIGASPTSTRKIYSTPDDSTQITLDISQEVRGLLKQIGFDLGDSENQDLLIYIYTAEDTGEEMMLIYSEEKLIAIIVADV